MRQSDSVLDVFSMSSTVGVSPRRTRRSLRATIQCIGRPPPFRHVHQRKPKTQGACVTRRTSLIVAHLAASRPRDSHFSSKFMIPIHFGRSNKPFRMRFRSTFMLPKRRFWKSEPTFPDACSKQFSKIRRPNRVLTPLKSASKTHSERLVQWFVLPKSSFGRGKNECVQ